ncbi:caspase recruitment domain-containing protein 8-like isoform X2 [Sparus aurata]|uniref:caspase recruitment domain-containing protein 8-like isoform X2 n=1 Tax=Sparus aurata TaxID=8175 RepID=UPI0011C14957|nr:caspase recruitment domain-containing protein 8-like isoform X2 [Sparus aurata]
MSDSVKEEVVVESSGASLLSVKKEGHEVESQGSSGLSVTTDGSKDPPPRFDTQGMKRSHDSEEEQLSLDTDLSQDPLRKIAKLSPVSGPSGTGKYTVISSPEQYQRYKDDFNSQYSEYRRLHAQLQLICRHLTKLQNEFEQVKQSKEKKKMIHHQLLQEYLKIQKTYPNYNQERKRLEYLHNKLGHIKKSIAMFRQSRPGQVSSLSSHPGNVNKAPPHRPEQNPSTSESNLPVSEDIREESKEDEEDPQCPDDPERSNQQHQLLCGEDKQHFQSELLTESGKTSYRFRCPGSGVFHCEATGLVFVMVQEAELLYRTVQWDESLLRSADKMAAGLLFDIKCSEDAAVCQLHLPHCEVMDAPLPEGLLSVVHITDDGMNFLEPLEITDTHVVVTVSHFSAFGIVRKFIKRLLSSNDMRPISGQVLLFLGQPNPKTQRQKLNVFLLPRNIHLDEVSAQQRYSENIQVPAKCELIEDQSYTLHCPQAIKIQPKSAKFNMEFGPNYFPTFEVRLPTTTEEVTLTVNDRGQLVVWEHDVDLNDSTRRTGQMNVPAEDDVLAEQRLSSIRSQFVERVSGPVLNQLLDKLLDLDFVNDEEMQSVKTKPTTQDKARKLIDTVRKKGTVASSVLIAALRKVDPNLSRQLMFS